MIRGKHYVEGNTPALREASGSAAAVFYPAAAVLQSVSDVLSG
jgi:hypothetical protein